MDRDWIEFDAGPVRYQRNRIHVSLSDKGELTMNSHAYEQMGEPEAVALLYSPKTDTIGLKPTGRHMPNAFAVRAKGAHGRRAVRMIPFIRRHDLRIEGTVRFSTAAVEDGVLVLDLTKMENTTLGPRAVRYRKRR